MEINPLCCTFTFSKGSKEKKEIRQKGRHRGEKKRLARRKVSPQKEIISTVKPRI